MRFISILFCALAVLYAASATAHQGGTTGYATITVSGQTVRYKLTLSAIPNSPLAEAMGLGQPNVAPKYGRLVEAIAETRRPPHVFEGRVSGVVLALESWLT